MKIIYRANSTGNHPGGGGGGGGGGDSNIKVTVMLVRRFKLNPLGRPLWVRLTLKLIPKEDLCLVSVEHFLAISL